MLNSDVYNHIFNQTAKLSQNERKNSTKSSFHAVTAWYQIIDSIFIDFKKYRLLYLYIKYVH
jgi:hypothetical protein